MYISSGLPRAGLGIALAMILFTPTFVGAQSSGGVRNADTKTSKKNAATAARTKAGTLPRTPDGQPDLQGYWTSLSFTPMERPAKYGGREFLTDEEQAQIYKEGVQHSYEFTFDDLAETPVYDSTVYALSAWQHGVAPNRRSSLVVDPPDGRIPPLTPEAAKARAAARKAGPNQDYANPNAPVKADVAEDLNLGERCLFFGNPPILPGGYDSDFHIVQSPGSVLIEYDRDSETRIIPLDGLAFFISAIRASFPWTGARIRRQISANGTVIRAAIGKAARWSSRPRISALAPRFKTPTPRA